MLAAPEPVKFDQTRFVVIDRQKRRFKTRRKEIPEEHKLSVARGHWLADILEQLRKHASAPPTKPTGTTAAVAGSLDLSPIITQLEEMRSHLTRRRDELQDALAPKIAELQKMNAQIASLATRIASLREPMPE